MNFIIFEHQSSKYAINPNQISSAKYSEHAVQPKLAIAMAGDEKPITLLGPEATRVWELISPPPREESLSKAANLIRELPRLEAKPRGKRPSI